MPRTRRLLIGPSPASNVAKALETIAAPSRFAWIVPTDASKRRVAKAAETRGTPLHVLTWDEFWDELTFFSGGLPARRLSGPVRSLLIDQAVALSRSEGSVDAIASVVDRPGYRRILAARAGVGAPFESDEPGRAEAAIRRRYRAIKDEFGYADDFDFRNQVLEQLHESEDLLIDRFPNCVLLDDGGIAGADLTLALMLVRTCESLVVVSSREHRGSCEPPWPASEFEVEPVLVVDRPAGLAAFESSVGAMEDDATLPVEGFKVYGGPGPEGQARLVAADLLASEDKDAAVLVTCWNASTREIVEKLADFGVPIQPPPPPPLDRDPSIVALLRAGRLPVDDWPVADLAKLLRHGGLSTAWAGEPIDPAKVAADLTSLGVHRGVRPILAALGRRKAGDGGTAAVVEALAALMAEATSGNVWSEHVSNCERIAASLGLSAAIAFQTLALHLADLSEARETIGRADERIDWPAFLAIVASIAAAETIETPTTEDGIESCTVDEFDGAWAARVFLVDLVEGSFPAESALKGPPVEKQDAYEREAARFRRVVRSASRELVLTYPTVDDEGEELLPSGFLDASMRRLPEDRPDVLARFNRFDPTFLGRSELALTPNDRRVLAMAEAAAFPGGFERLARLAASSEHREPLRGAAAALEMRRARFETDDFGPFDGRIASPEVAASLVPVFGPDAVLSASQIESYLWCPFQFFLKYVLRLAPGGERGELDDNYARFGEMVHDTLEQAHEALRATHEGAPLADEVRIAIQTRMSATLSTDDGDEVAQSLLSIEQERVARVLESYVEQYRAYLESAGRAFVPSEFEVSFGRGRRSDESGVLTLGAGPGQVRLQGFIDRVDLTRSEDGARFRIIDYKTFSVPGNKDVINGVYVQLPLYALAVERLGLLKAANSELLDFGYWGLSKAGFAPIKPPRGETDLRPLVDRVQEWTLAAVGRLRTGDFSIVPTKDDCSRACDYLAVCRLREVRNAGKADPRFGETAEADRIDVQAKD